jgi:RimJ/RimL family protein N-acetyltransferase
MLKTKRLILRQWTNYDLEPFSKINSDKKVMKFFPSPLTEDESHNMGHKLMSLIRNRGWGYWAIEIPNVEKFIGFVGLHIPKSSLPFSPCVEIGWRLSKAYWGMGYATEAANESLKYAFLNLDLDEVVSFTTLNNTRSRAVMKKIGMSKTDKNFMHPDIEKSHPLCEHVLYKINKEEWGKSAL